MAGARQRVGLKIHRMGAQVAPPQAGRLPDVNADGGPEGRRWDTCALHVRRTSGQRVGRACETPHRKTRAAAIMTAVTRFDRRRGAASRVPDGAGDGVAARPHLVVNLHRGQFPADAVVGAADREARLGQRALVGGHAGGRLCKKQKQKKPSSHVTQNLYKRHTGPRTLLCLQGRLSAVFVSRSSVKLGAEASRRTPASPTISKSFARSAITELNKEKQRM